LDTPLTSRPIASAIFFWVSPRGFTHLRQVQRERGVHCLPCRALGFDEGGDIGTGQQRVDLLRGVNEPTSASGPLPRRLPV
jgi:hypothetical protein